MKGNMWTTGDIQKLFRLEGKTRYAIFNAEEKGLIPVAERVSRGTTQVRSWKVEQLPSIGEHFGFLKKPKKQIVICIYTPKGGVLKTTFGYNLARTLALNGIKVLVAGLDIAQSSMTGYALPSKSIESLEDLESEDLGLYHFFFDKKGVKDIIKHSSLPTLDVIPETPHLNLLERKIGVEVNREHFIKSKLMQELQDYDVILFDNGPSWNKLVENSLNASTVIISPIGCDIEAFKSVDKNLSMILEFQNAIGAKWDHLIQVPTLLEPNKLSQQIYGAYLKNFSETIIPIPIRRSIKGQEARAYHECVMEHDPTSNLADDYYKAITEIWNRITS